MTDKTQQILIVSILIIGVTYLIVSNSKIFTNTGNYNEQGVQLNVEPKLEYYENGIFIKEVEGGVNSGSGTIHNTKVIVGERK